MKHFLYKKKIQNVISTKLIFAITLKFRLKKNPEQIMQKNTKTSSLEKSLNQEMYNSNDLTTFMVNQM